MTKATAGERLAMRWFDITRRELVGWAGGYELAKSADRLLARERRKVAEDVLAMLGGVRMYQSDFDMFCKEVRAKYGKGKR